MGACTVIVVEEEFRTADANERKLIFEHLILQIIKEMELTCNAWHF